MINPCELLQIAPLSDFILVKNFAAYNCYWLKNCLFEWKFSPALFLPYLLSTKTPVGCCLDHMDVDWLHKPSLLGPDEIKHLTIHNNLQKPAQKSRVSFFVFVLVSLNLSISAGLTDGRKNFWDVSGLLGSVSLTKSLILHCRTAGSPYMPAPILYSSHGAFLTTVFMMHCDVIPSASWPTGLILGYEIGVNLTLAIKKGGNPTMGIYSLVHNVSDITSLDNTSPPSVWWQRRPGGHLFPVKSDLDLCRSSCTETS